ncbi:class ii aldolase and adducin domain-containing protein [Ophiostoma piceae UAMH 11346]|uniref:Class ii aldolase and adducin domain-containing protein n=1 Tax=Ophiostoma piceae (strain UAMH 11346) TaxID=1262450 RepID=S3D6M0_OPHP1|nr:class ii aldolase and adducin domain-containing protein [Ophiostoma piceae UAMH 11346]
MSSTTTVETTASAATAAPVSMAVPKSALDSAASADGTRSRRHVIPWPTEKLDQRRWQLEQMAAAFRIFAKLGFADGSSGHISLRDPVEPETFWINPYSVHFATLKVSHMVQVDEHGNRVGGADRPVNTAGFIIHAAIHKARPDIKAACHMHSPYGRAWSTFGKGIDMLNQDSCMFYDDLSIYPAFGGVVHAAEEGKRIASALGPKNKNLIMQNHGLLTGGGTVAEAAAFFIALERACQTQVLVDTAIANSGGQLQKTYVGEQEAIYTKEGTGTPEVMYMQFKPEYELVLEETKGAFLK